MGLGGVGSQAGAVRLARAVSAFSICHRGKAVRRGAPLPLASSNPHLQIQGQAHLTLGDIRPRARASTSWALTGFSVLGGCGSSAGSMSGTLSTSKRGCQHVSCSSGTTMGGSSEARKACGKG